MKKNIKEVVRKFRRENPAARLTYDALLARGMSHRFAEEEIGRVVLGCLWEKWHDMPDRMDSVFEAIQQGRTAEELFPDSLSEGTSKGRASWWLLQN